LICPVGSWHADAMANADAPPPDGSTATTTCRVLPARNSPPGSIVTRRRGLLRNASMSLEANALFDESAPMPIDSRRIIAGSCRARGCGVAPGLRRGCAAVAHILE
jgi:hypothetical protein